MKPGFALLTAASGRAIGHACIVALSSLVSIAGSDAAYAADREAAASTSPSTAAVHSGQAIAVAANNGTSSGAQADPAMAPEPGQLEEIVVTARKWEESLQQVPASISAITRDDLSKRSLDNLSAIGQSTPNFTFSQNAQNGRSAGVVYIRGVGQADTHASYDPAVGIYVDGVFLGRMQANDIDLLDVQRVEILRGPQGTLFGKNTSGGAVNIITRQPDASAGGFSGRLLDTFGSRDRADIVGEINLPLATNSAAILLSGARRKQHGYGRRADGQDTGSTDRDLGRASLLLKPAEKFSALLSVDATSYDETNAVMKLVYVNTAAAPIAALNAHTPDQDHYDSRWLSPSDFFNYGTGPNSSRGNLWGSSLTLDYDAGPANLKSISAYRHMIVHNDLDPDGSPITVLEQFETVRQHQFSQEMQATGNSFDHRLHWVLGVYYFDEAVSDNVDLVVLPPLFGYGASVTVRPKISSSSYAGYGQGSYDLSGRLKFTAGLRYTYDHKDVERVRLAFPSGAPLEPTVTKTVDSNDVSPHLGFDYQWTSTVMNYVSVAKGYKAGGFDGGAGTQADFVGFKPETVWTYELGLRSDLLDRRVRFNTTAFYSDYSNLQFQINGSTVASGAPVPFSVVTNIPKARITGGEVELEVIPGKRLKLVSGLGLTYAKYTELPTDAKFIAANLINRSSQFVNSPKLSFTLGAEYATPLGDAFKLVSRIDYAYKSTIYYHPTNSLLLRQQPYGLLNARLMVEYQPSQISLAVFGTNLTDQHYIVGGFDDADVPNPGLGFSFTNMASPRELGVSAQVRF